MQALLSGMGVEDSEELREAPPHLSSTDDGSESFKAIWGEKRVIRHVYGDEHIIMLIAVDMSDAKIGLILGNLYTESIIIKQEAVLT